MVEGGRRWWLALVVAFALGAARASAQDVRLAPFPPSPLVTLGGDWSSSTSTTFAASGSTWWTRHPEHAVFHARMRHVQRGTAGDVVPARGFDVRIGRGGQLWSWRGAFGESIAPQFRSTTAEHPDPDYAPWVDEVWQIVAQNRLLNEPPDHRYFIHQAGVYLLDPVLAGPFYSPTLAAGPGVPEFSYVVVSWSQHAHVPTTFRSGLVTYAQYRDAGGGVLEVSVVAYNAGPDVLDRWNVPWGGVRASSLPVHELAMGGRLVTLSPSIPFGDDANRDVYERTDGYGLFRTDTGGAALGLVFGTDRRAVLAADQWGDAQYRSGTAQSGTERDLRVATVIRPVTVDPGEALWARFYFVVGSRTAVLSVIDAYALVANAEYGVLRIAPEDSALLGYDVDATGLVGPPVDPADARFALWALPVAGGVPVFRLGRAAGGEVLSGSPYAVSDPPYDGRTTRWELLGYAYEVGTEPAAPAGFDSVPIEDVLPAAGYRAEGRSLRVLCRAQPLPDAGGDEDAATIDGSLDVTAIDAPTLPEDGPATPHAPAADAGCGCRTDARGGRGCVFLALALVALHVIRAGRSGRETEPSGRRTEPTACAHRAGVRTAGRGPRLRRPRGGRRS